MNHIAVGLLMGLAWGIGIVVSIFYTKEKQLSHDENGKPVDSYQWNIKE